MNTLIRWTTVTAILLCGLLISCSDDNPTNTPSQAARVTLTHSSFDFSELDNNPATSDGETILWMPGGGEHPEYNGISHVWWRNSHLDATNGLNKTKDMGIVELSSVTSVPTDWDVNPAIAPLLVDHVIVAQCADGVVKFKVVSTDTLNEWPAVVDFEFMD